MEEATNRQKLALNGYAKKQKFSEDVLSGVVIDKLSKAEASKLISMCKEITSSILDENGDFVLSFSQNFKKKDLSFATVRLSEAELEKVRLTHREHCRDVMAECLLDYRDNSERLFAVFEKRCDKVFTWIQQALEEKVRKSRGGGNYGTNKK